MIGFSHSGSCGINYGYNRTVLQRLVVSHDTTWKENYEFAIWTRALTTQEIQELSSVSSNYTYAWSPGGETTSSITVQPSTTTTYTVDVTSGTTTCQSDVIILQTKEI